MGRDASGDQFAAIARSLSLENGVVATLEQATATAVKVIDGCDHAGVSLVTGRRAITTTAQSDEVVGIADALQLETGQGSCLQSIEEQETVYALNLFSAPPDAFCPAERAVAVALAAHVAVATVSAHDREHLELALTHRTSIGQAQGMLIQALRIRPEQAFASLVRISQARNAKLHDVAADIVERGAAPTCSDDPACGARPRGTGEA